MAVEGQQIEMPNEDDIMVFKNHYKKLKAPFLIYADFGRGRFQQRKLRLTNTSITDPAVL